MDGDMSARIKAVLDDPETFGKIIAAVNAFSSANRSAPQEEEKSSEASNAVLGNPVGVSETPVQPALSFRGGSSFFSHSSGGDNRLALLLALKPFLSRERQRKIDSVTKAFTVASVIKNAKNL